jgi:hypothetical protein
VTAPRLRSLAVALVLTLPALGPAVAGAGTACAAEAAGTPHAALVVDNGSRTTTYCVALDGATVSGLRLIQLAAGQYGLQYRLGFGGQAVCQLDGVGPEGGDCFADYPDFWGYWHGDSGGGWSWAGSGAASASIGDGDVEGWVWGPGDTGSTHAAPPALALEDVCDTPPSPAPSPPPGGGGGGGTGGGGTGGGTGGTGGSGDSGDGGGSGASGSSGVGVSAAPTATPGSRASAHPDRGATTTPSAATSGEIVQASPVGTLAAADASGGGGPPTGALIALIATVALGAAGWFTLRRRRADDPP